jgi:toxin ParE1/3/4
MPGYVLRTPAASADLRDISDYIGVKNQSPVAAHKFLDDFEQKCLAYANQPEMGELRLELGDELRSFTFKKNYVAVFQPYEDGIEIIRVIHGARDYPTLFGG